MKSRILLTSAFVLLGTVFVTGPAGGDDLHPQLSQCFAFDAGDSPSSEDLPTARETWCYYPIKDEPQKTYFVYRVGEFDVTPEMAFISDAEGNIIHASRLAGKLDVFAAKTRGYNPFDIPFTPPASLALKAEPLSPSAKNVLSFLYNAPKTVVEMPEISELADTVPTVATASFYPWRGYWWPYRSARLRFGVNSPLAKYDRFVRARGGVSQAQQWEASNHLYRGISWQGHCNGWAASSILRPEPRSSIKDPETGIVFSVSDLKGLLAEKDNCVQFKFFGRRHRGRASDNPRDIVPSLFHQTITYYIGQLKKPVLMDEMQFRGVENRVVSGYKMAIQKIGPNKYSVVTTLRVHKYDLAPSVSPGTAPYLNFVFKYTLTTNSQNQIIGGSWITKNPDFLWVPLGFAECLPTNPYITGNWIDQIFN